MPPVTVKSNEPVSSPKQVTLVTAIPELNALGSFTVAELVEVQSVCVSVTVTV